MNLSMRITLKTAVVFGLVLFGLSLAGYKYVGHLKQKAIEANLVADKQWELATHAQAKLASTQMDNRQLAALVVAANEINGKLIAALRINVPKRDTLVVHDTLPTERAPDSTRTATFRDSSFAGVVQGKVTAPPWPQPLGVSYTFTRPAFSPTVGFVRVGSKTVAVVDWHGEKFTIDAPYAEPPKRSLKWLGEFVAISYDSRRRLGGRVGLRITPVPSTELKAGLDTRRDMFVELEHKF